MEDVMIPVAMIGMFWVTGWIFKTFLTTRRMNKLAQLQADMQTRLLDKVNSAEEMRSYIESDAGRKFMESVTIEKGNPYGRILFSIQAGLIMAFVGAAMLLMRGQLSEGFEAFTFLGSISLALGLGFFLSAIAAYVLSKNWGLINGKE